jgi:hypothetical protein
MNKPIFTHNIPNASCAFCDRTKNPHPDYTHEPIVITRLKLHQGEQEMCINCYWDMVAVANASDASIMDIATEKLNVMRLLSKQASSNAPTS